MEKGLSEEEESSKPSLIGMIMNPGEQFERIRGRSLIWGALAIVTVLFVIGSWLQSLGIEMPGMESMTAQDVAMINRITLITTIVTAILFPIFTVLIMSVIYMLIAKIARSEVLFKQLISMNTYIMFISAIGSVLNGILFTLFGGGTGVYYTSLGSLIEAEGALAGLLDSIEIFAIWNVILTAIGLEKVANFSKGLAWTISIIFFAIGVLFTMFGAAVSGMAGM